MLMFLFYALWQRTNSATVRHTLKYVYAKAQLNAMLYYYDILKHDYKLDYKEELL